jgi:hypothetical protein
VLEISCQDGSTGRVVLGADDLDEAGLPVPLSFVEPTRCTVTQPASGVADDATVTAAGNLEPASGNAPVGIPATIEIALEVPEYTLTVTDTFSRSRPEASRAGVLSSFSMLPMALIGSGLFGLGALMLLVIVVRSRRSAR